MTPQGYIRGYLCFYINNEWRYSDDTIADRHANCAKCGRPPTPEGYDACLGYLPGIVGACCGHGVEKSYSISIAEAKVREEIFSTIPVRYGLTGNETRDNPDFENAVGGGS